MRRCLAASFLVLLIAQCLPLGLLDAGCDMPCCKRSGKGDCCPRRMEHRLSGRDASAGCRLVACGPRALESGSLGPHQPALPETEFAMGIPLRAMPTPEPLSPRSKRPDSQPPTPPPRDLLG